MQGGSIRLFKIFGVEVFLHFSWFLVAAYQFSVRRHEYVSAIFPICEYIALFVIVLMHEFGHALACRQTGGTADRIMLWPLGGIAFVRPPERAGAQLWAIAAGPLVNVCLIPVLLVASLVAGAFSGSYGASDPRKLLSEIQSINLALLLFNLLPFYPLDGGQILRSLLWFPLGRIRSLQVASAIGFVGGIIGGAAGVYYFGSLWIGVMAFFLVSQAAVGWRHARELTLAEEQARLAPVELERPPVI
ncbi:MAG: M50 family metallopeptidase [Chthoniobacterales bacterium]